MNILGYVVVLLSLENKEVKEGDGADPYYVGAKFSRLRLKIRYPRGKVWYHFTLSGADHRGIKSQVYVVHEVMAFATDADGKWVDGLERDVVTGTANPYDLLGNFIRRAIAVGPEKLHRSGSYAYSPI